VPDAFVRDVPVELGLELAPIIDPYFLDPEGKFLIHRLNEVNGTSLGMLACP
jgi:hypothetical protein